MGGVLLAKVSRLAFPATLIAKSKGPALSLSAVRAASGCQTISSLAPVARLLLPSFLARATEIKFVFHSNNTVHTQLKRGEAKTQNSWFFALCAAKFSNKDLVTSLFGFLFGGSSMTVVPGRQRSNSRCELLVNKKPPISVLRRSWLV